MLDPRQLEALTAVAAEGSVARAARRLGWSQPTVDYHLRALDALVGAALVTRNSRGTALTAAGHLMHNRAQELRTLSDRALTDVREFARLGRQKLRFGAFPTAAARLLPGIVSRLTDVGIEVVAVLEEIAPLVTSVNQRALDAALVYTASGHTLPFRADVHTTELFTDPLLLALPRSHPAATLSVFTAADVTALHEIPWVFSATPGDTLDDVVREVFAEAGTPFDVSVRTDDYSVALALVAAGLGMGLVPQLAATHPPAGVVLRRIDDARFSRDILLAAPAQGGAPEAVLRQLAEAIRRSTDELELPPI